MATTLEVKAILLTYGDTDGYDSDLLLEESERGLEWVNKRLRDGTNSADPLIAETAAAIAHWFFFMKKLTDTDKYESYKAGDLTVKRSLQNELKFERELRNEAIAAASSILKDEEFCFIGN